MTVTPAANIAEPLPCSFDNDPDHDEETAGEPLAPDEPMPAGATVPADLEQRLRATGRAYCAMRPRQLALTIEAAPGRSLDSIVDAITAQTGVSAENLQAVINFLQERDF